MIEALKRLTPLEIFKHNVMQKMANASLSGKLLPYLIYQILK